MNLVKLFRANSAAFVSHLAVANCTCLNFDIFLNLDDATTQGPPTPVQALLVLPPLTDVEVNLRSRLLVEAKAEGDLKRVVAADLWHKFFESSPEANVYLTALKVVKTLLEFSHICCRPSLHEFVPANIWHSCLLVVP